MSNNVIDIKTRRPIKSEPDDTPKLRVDRATGKVTGSPHFRRPEDDAFGDRMQRVKQSLEKINALMQELNRIGKNREDD